MIHSEDTIVMVNPNSTWKLEVGIAEDQYNQHM